MLAERRRALRLLGDRSLLSFWLARFLDRAADWLFLLTVLVLSWNRTGDASLAAWSLALWFAPRVIVLGLFDAWTRRLSPGTWAWLGAARAVALAVVFVAFWLHLLADPQLLLGAAGVLGFLSAAAASPRSAALSGRTGLAHVGLAAQADAFVDRLAALIAPLVTGILLFVAEPAAALAAAAVTYGLAALLAYAQLKSITPIEPRVRAEADADADEARQFPRRSALYLVAAFTAGALGAALFVTTLDLAAGPELASTRSAPFLIAAYGLGLMLGPLPVARLLLRIPAPLLLIATVLLQSVAAIAIVVAQSFAVALPLMLVLGIIAVNQDALRAIAIRRLVPADLYERVVRLMLIALTVGQIYGAIGVVSIGAAPDPYAILVVLAVSQVLLVLLGLALGGRQSLQIGGLSSLPIKSVVHKLSWETRPVASPGHLEQSSNQRARRLARWINRSVSLQKLSVTLPVSGRHYEIYRPDEESRERLFEQGRSDPDKQMPYWAKVWPSGVALADVVVERREEVAGAHVLELGAGLGVTACAVLEFGGEIVTADYSDLPLAHCRLNTLVNTNKAPSATCFNWRHPAEVAAAAAHPQSKGGYPLIIAGDVLYEGRDAEPLLNVIDKMLVADGSLWLAEPVRRTAQRFLDSAASLGWEIESRQVQAEWPDNTEGPVNLHFLTRSAVPDSIPADLGGLRI